MLGGAWKTKVASDDQSQNNLNHKIYNGLIGSQSNFKNKIPMHVI